MARLDIDLAHPSHAIPPIFYGLMTEEINHSYDGGLFAELIQNRTFQDPGNGRDAAPIHWSVVGSGKVSTGTVNPVNPALPVSLRLQLAGGTGGVANDGYWGIPVRPGTKYTASFYAKAGDNPLFPALRSGHRLFQRPSPQKQFPSNSQSSLAPWWTAMATGAPLA